MSIQNGFMPHPHDLLEVDPGSFMSSSMHIPEWVEPSLNEIPFVVCRRSPPLEGKVAIGVRGSQRNMRWAGILPQEAIKNVISPHELANYVSDQYRIMQTPALQAFEIMNKRWHGCSVLWGPGGSVGFELATGRSTATPKSDLDIVITAPTVLSKLQAAVLCETAEGLPCAIDIRVETPVSSFSLLEYASTSRILLRLPGGSLLGVDPWDLQLTATVKL